MYLLFPLPFTFYQYCDNGFLSFPWHTSLLLFFSPSPSLPPLLLFTWNTHPFAWRFLYYSSTSIVFSRRPAARCGMHCIAFECVSHICILAECMQMTACVPWFSSTGTLGSAVQLHAVLGRHFHFPRGKRGRRGGNCEGGWVSATLINYHVDPLCT